MSRWTDPQEWERLVSGETCPVCHRSAPLEVVTELEVSSVMMGEDAPLRGYCWLLFRRHAVELHHLTPEEAAAYMRDIQRLSRAIKSATGAVKMNYEVHGNTLPHLHMHFFPRYIGDAFEGGPIDPRAVKGPVYAAGEFAAMRRRIALALEQARGEELPAE